MKNESEKRITLRLPEDLAQKITAQAMRGNISLNSMIIEAIETFVAMGEASQEEGDRIAAIEERLGKLEGLLGQILPQEKLGQEQSFNVERLPQEEEGHGEEESHIDVTFPQEEELGQILPQEEEGLNLNNVMQVLDKELGQILPQEEEGQEEELPQAQAKVSWKKFCEQRPNLGRFELIEEAMATFPGRSPNSIRDGIRRALGLLGRG